MRPSKDHEGDGRDRAPAAARITPARLAAYQRFGRRLRARAMGRAAARVGSALCRLVTLGACRRRAPTAPDDDFLALVASGLRTPLTSIRASAEILRDYPDLTPEERRHFLEVVIAEDERLAQVVTEILEASEYQANTRRWQVHTEPLEDRLAPPAA